LGVTFDPTNPGEWFQRVLFYVTGLTFVVNSTKDVYFMGRTYLLHSILPTLQLTGTAMLNSPALPCINQTVTKKSYHNLVIRSPAAFNGCPNAYQTHNIGTTGQEIALHRGTQGGVPAQEHLESRFQVPRTLDAQALRKLDGEIRPTPSYPPNSSSFSILL
jgi:hypothetical protein